MNNERCNSALPLQSGIMPSLSMSFGDMLSGKERPPGKPPLALATTSGCGCNIPSSNFSCPMSVAPATAQPDFFV